MIVCACVAVSQQLDHRSAETELSETNETNETNESCLHSTTQEEPLEVIDLDEIYKFSKET
jgi:hypothetical protein